MKKALWRLTIRSYWLRRKLFSSTGGFEEARDAGVAWIENHPRWNDGNHHGVRAKFKKVRQP